MTGERSVSELLQDAVRHLQEIVRAEVRLARAEITEDAKGALMAGAWVGAGAFFALSAWIFLLWTIAYGLAIVMPIWAATLVVALLMSGAAAYLVMSGMRRVKRLRPVPDRTIESIRENIEWLKPSMR